MASRVAGNGVADAHGAVPAREVWKLGAIAAAGAAVINMVLLAIAKAAGVEFMVPDPQGKLVEVGLGQVALMSIAPLLLGTAAAAIAVRYKVNLRWVQGLALVLTLLSFIAPLSLDSGTSTKLILAAMHVVAGVAFVGAIERFRPRES